MMRGVSGETRVNTNAVRAFRHCINVFPDGEAVRSEGQVGPVLLETSDADEDHRIGFLLQPFFKSRPRQFMEPKFGKHLTLLRNLVQCSGVRKLMNYCADT